MKKAVWVLCLFIGVALQAQTLQQTLQDSLNQAKLGEVPAKWKTNRGDWKVRLDETYPPEGTTSAKKALEIAPEMEKLSLLTRTLSTDQTGGTIEYPCDESDFELNYQMKHSTARNYWGNAFNFRVSKDGKESYMVKRERHGKFSLYRVSGRNQTLLQTSSAPMKEAQGIWNWVTVKALGNHIEVYSSADGVNYGKFIDYTDDSPTALKSGKISFAGCNRFRYRFLNNPWNDDENLKKMSAFLTKIEQKAEFKDDLTNKQLWMSLVVNYFVNNAKNAPKELKVANQVVPVSTIGGEHQAIVLFPMEREQKILTVPVEYGKQKVDIQVKNMLYHTQNSDLPIVEIDYTTPISRQTYLDLDNKILEYYKGKKIGWENRFGASAVLYKATKDPVYLAQVMEWVRSWLKDYNNGKGKIQDFHFANRLGFANTVDVALEHGEMSSDERTQLLAMLAETAAKSNQEGAGVMNRALGYSLPITKFLKWAPLHPMREELKKFHSVMMSDFMNTKEGVENSSNYFPITAFWVLLWIEENNLQAMYQDPELKNYFDMALQLMDTSGGLPNFADYGGKRIHSSLLIALHEALATIYKDGHHKWAAQQMMRVWQTKNINEMNGWDVEALAWAVYFADDSIKAVRPDFGSELLVKNVGVLDKLLLRSSYDPNAFNVTVDMVNGGEHGDAMSLAVVAVNNDGGQSLIDKAGRSTDFHSVPLIKDNKADFPYNQKTWEYGRWNSASFDLRLFWSWGSFYGGAGGLSAHQHLGSQGGAYPIDFAYNPKLEFAFAWELTGFGKVKVYIDNVRLVKSGKTPDHPEKVLVLDDFTKDSYRWIGNFRQVKDKERNRDCGEFLVDFYESNYIGKKFPVALDIYGKDYDRIEFDFKFEPLEGGAVGRWSVLHVGDSLGAPRNYPFFHSQNFPVQTKFFQENAKSSFAGFAINERSEAGDSQSREREFIFIKDKFLWVRDILTPPKDQKSVAGAAWQLGDLTNRSGSNWVESKVDTNLITWILPRKETIIELNYNPSPSNDGENASSYIRFYPAYLTQMISQEVSAGKPLTFDSLLIPSSDKLDAQKVVDSIKVLYDKDGVTLLQVGEDLILRNPTKSKVKIGNIESDSAILYINNNAGKEVAREELK